MIQYKVLRADRASQPVEADQILYYGNDCFGCASDDSRILGIEYMPVSFNQNGAPFFTIPKADVERIESE